MKNYTVLIADDDKDWLFAIKLSLEEKKHFHVIATCTDGIEALELIEQSKPDILIIDIIMPNFDGINLITHIRKHMTTYHPLIYVVTGNGSSYAISASNTLYVDYFSLKPLPAATIVSTLEKLMLFRIGDDQKLANITTETLLEKPNVTSTTDGLCEKIIFRLLCELGLMPQKKYFVCTKIALLATLEEPLLLSQITKGLYPVIAKKCDTSVKTVEHEIRYCRQKILKVNTLLSQEIFQPNQKLHLSNGNFLSILMLYIQKEMSYLMSSQLDEKDA